jgi:uncharacterized protein YbaP (TraB family)
MWPTRFALGVVAAMVLVLPAWAKPALWVVRSPTATIYLFGTIHALKPDTPWRSPKLEHAFASSKELWLEIVDGGSYRASFPLIQRLGTDYRKPLSSKLSRATLDKVDAALKANGLSDGRAKVEWLRPWAVAQMVGDAKAGAGMERGSGADLSLQEDAAEADKPVRGLETKEQQLRIFADLPPPVEIAYLEDVLAHRNEGGGEIDALVAAWLAGDVDKLAKLQKEHDGPVADELYRRLLVERNKNWAAKIKELLTGSGTIMIAGGAFHFAGPDSVLVQLQTLGIVPERVQ